MYNLIMSADPDFIGKGKEDFATRRLMEHTQKPFVDRYGQMNEEDIKYILSLPTLAIPEFPNKKPGRLVEITAIRHVTDGFVFEFKILNNKAEIPFEKLEILQTDLDIAKIEVYRHHYAMKDVNLSDVLQLNTPKFPVKKLSTEQTKVFIVHGHNHHLRDRVSCYLRELSIEPLILSEHANLGDPLTTKFIRVAQQAKYAVILFTPDDLGRANNNDTEKPRARQNVVFELGYFIGKLGANRVALISSQHVEHPTDYAGIGRIIYDESESSDNWKLKLKKELVGAKIID